MDKKKQTETKHASLFLKQVLLEPNLVSCFISRNFKVQTGPNVIKLFSGQSKLECLSLASFFERGIILRVRQRANPENGTPLGGALG